MRRWVWRGTLAIMAVLVLLGTAGGVKAYTLACDGSLEGFRYLTRVRDEIAEATAPPPTPRPTVPPTATALPTPTRATSTPAAQATSPPTATPVPTITPTPTPSPTRLPAAYVWVREVAGDVAEAGIGVILRIKQDDTVAYPAHILAAHILDASGCSEDAIRIQWLKAGLHASQEGQPERIAQALGERARAPDDRAQLRQIVRVWSERAPRSRPLRRVLAALDALDA